MKRMDCCSGVSSHKGWCRMRIEAPSGEYRTGADIHTSSIGEVPEWVIKNCVRKHDETKEDIEGMINRAPIVTRFTQKEEK